MTSVPPVGLLKPLTDVLLVFFLHFFSVEGEEKLFSICSYVLFCLFIFPFAFLACHNTNYNQHSTKVSGN